MIGILCSSPFLLIHPSAPGRFEADHRARVAWNQWHSLAVATAELCSQTEGPLVDRAWSVVDEAFQVYSETVADTKTGMLWRPIQKLMKKAKQNRNLAQMAKLNLANKDQDLAQKAGPTPAPNASIPQAWLAQGQTSTADNTTQTGANGTFRPGIWENGLLGPGSTSSSLQNPLPNENLDGRAPTPGGLPDNYAFNMGTPNMTQASGDPYMAWMDWEGFIGDVNFDFEMPDLTGDFPQQR